MVNLLVIDDDKEILEGLVKKIKELFPNINVIPYASIEKLQRNADMVSYQYVLSDIFIGKQSGIDAYNIISRNGKIPVVYMSGADQNEFDVYDAPHVYFLQKPIDDAKLQKALDKLFNSKQMLTIKTSGRESYVDVAKIMYLESDKRIVHIITIDNMYNTYAKLDDYDYLTSSGFLRISKSCIVNKAFIEEKTREKIKLNNGEEMAISRHYQ